MNTMERLGFQERCRRELLQNPVNLPSLPRTIVQALKLLKDPDAEIEAFEQVLKNDAALVVSLLRLVNSALYGLKTKKTAIGEAIMVLGFRGLRSLLLVAGSAKYMEQDYSCYGHVPRGLWLHALATATSARKIAKSLEFNLEFREEVFTAGLLHDIGKFLIIPYLAKAAKLGLDFDHVDCEVEQELLGTDHQEVGAKVAEKWDLGNLIQTVLANHHCLAGENEEALQDYRQQLAVVRLANWLAHEHGAGFTKPETQELSSTLVEDIASLQMNEATWLFTKDEILEDLTRAVAEMAL